MKKKLIWGTMLIVSTLFAACTQQQSNTTFTVTGHISGLNDGDTIQLVPGAIHHNEAAYAKTVVNGGEFTFKGAIDEPRVMNLMIKDSYGSAKFVLENAKIHIDGKASMSPAQDNTPRYHYEVKTTGSPLTLRFDSLVAVRDSMNKVRNAFEVRYREFFAARNKAMAEKDSKKLAELQQSETAKAMMKEDEDFFHLVETSYNKVIADNKDTYWGPMMMLELTAYLTPDQKDMYEAFSQEAKDSYYGNLVKEELYPAGNIGQQVKPFTVKDAEGKDVTLATLLEGKKYLLIDFWASWCGPCRREIPNLKNLYKQYAEKGFQIVSISIDKNESDWQKALKEEGLEWPNFRSQEVSDLYRVKSVPTMYLIDSKGVLVGTDLRGEALVKKLAELFQ